MEPIHSDPDPTSFLNRKLLIKHWSLRAKLILAFVGIVVLAVCVVAFSNDYVIRTDLSNQIGANLNSLARSQALAIGENIVAEIKRLQSFSLSNEFQDAIENSNAAYRGDSGAIKAKIDDLDQQWRIADEANN